MSHHNNLRKNKSLMQSPGRKHTDNPSLQQSQKSSSSKVAKDKIDACDVTLVSMADASDKVNEDMSPNHSPKSMSSDNLAQEFVDLDPLVRQLQLFNTRKQQGNADRCKALFEQILEINKRNKAIHFSLREELAFLNGRLCERDALRQELTDIVTNVPTRPVTEEHTTYADAAAKTPNDGNHKQIPTLIIKKKDYRMRKQEIRDVMKKIQVKDLHIDDCIQLRNTGDYIIKSFHEEDLDTLIDRIQKAPEVAEKVSIQKKGPRMTRLTIFGIPEDVTPHDILERLEIKLQLQENTLSEEIMTKKIVRKDNAYNQALYVTEPLGRKLLQIGKINLGFQICPIRRHIIVIRCFKCQRYGHTEQQCMSKERCASCAGEHRTQDCSTPDKICCINCYSLYRDLQSKNYTRPPFDYHHRASDRNCQFYKDKYDAIRNRIEGVNPASGSIRSS